MGRIVLIQYLVWHFFDVPKAILGAWKNFLYFNLKYFSIPTLIKTLFFPWRKYKYSYGRAWDPMRYFEAFVFNTFSRTIGFMLRIFLIVFGLFLEIPIIFGGAIILVTWIILPLLLIVGLILGFGLLI